MCGAFGTFAHQAYTARHRGQLSSNVRRHEPQHFKTTITMKKLLSLLAISFIATSCTTTPFGAGYGLTGGTKIERITERTWTFTTGINGWTPESQLKPQMLTRASELGKQNHFSTFRLDSIELLRGGPCECYSASALITFNPADTTRSPVYTVGQITPYETKPMTTAPKGSATLLGPATAENDSASMLAEAVFFDSVGFGPSTTSLFSSDTVYYLPSGPNTILVFARSMRAIFDGRAQAVFQLNVELESDKRYRLNASLDDSEPQVWIEDATTGVRVRTRSRD
jgi:hypothetical protein